MRYFNTTDTICWPFLRRTCISHCTLFLIVSPCITRRFRTSQGHCASCLKKWSLSPSELCACSDTETMPQVMVSCPINKLDSGIHYLHSADETAVQWLKTHLAWHIWQWQQLYHFLLAGYLSCKPTDSVQAMKETEGTNPNYKIADTGFALW